MINSPKEKEKSGSENITIMDTPNRKDIRDMTREAQFQTQLLTQQGNLNISLLFSVGICVKFIAFACPNLVRHFSPTTANGKINNK